MLLFSSSGQMSERQRKKKANVHQTDEISTLDKSLLLEDNKGFGITVREAWSISMRDELFN